MNSGSETLSANLIERVARIERRLDQLEQALQPAAARELHTSVEAESAKGVAVPARSPDPVAIEEDLEQVIGQRWFAHVGILVLALGAAFALSLPYPGAPPVLPAALGASAAGGLLVLARSWRKSFSLISSYLGGAAMALFYFSVLRLYFFGATPVLRIDSWMGRCVLLAIVGLNLGLALRRSSPYLAGLALGMGYLTLALLDSAGLLCVGITVLSGLVVECWRRHGWHALLLLNIPAAYLTHFVWMLDGSFGQGAFQPGREPVWSVYFILIYAVVMGLAPLIRRMTSAEESFEAACALFNAGMAFGLYWLHSAVAFESAMMSLQLVAAAVFLAMAVVLWCVRRSELACSIYAMTGYWALSVVLLNAFTVPDVFVWLSLQSVLVVITALWFCSPFIVVANFFIYVAIVLGYVIVAGRETGISLGFGLVALISARILNWQKERLQLRTEKMRNAYLFSALVVFPYALYHLVPRAYVAVSWVGVAAMYYLLNLLIRNQKYRWMGHCTLLFTLIYLLVIGITQLAPAQRVFSFLVLGTVLVAVSLVFTRSHHARRGSPGD
jgi:hypothetical protein